MIVTLSPFLYDTPAVEQLKSQFIILSLVETMPASKIFLKTDNKIFCWANVCWGADKKAVNATITKLKINIRK